MVKKSENPEKSQKISKIHFFCNFFSFLKKIFFQKKKKKCYPLSFPILGGRDSTRALQSSPLQKYENLKNLKNSLFFKKINKKKKINKCYSLSFPILGGCDSTRALQSSPFQNPGGVPWAWRRTNQEEEGNPGVLFWILIYVFLFSYRTSTSATLCQDEKY